MADNSLLHNFSHIWSFVKIKKGHHSGDITQVININSETMCSQANCIDVMVVPRVCKLGWDKISFPIIVKAHMQLPDPALFGALELRGKYSLKNC